MNKSHWIPRSPFSCVCLFMVCSMVTGCPSARINGGAAVSDGGGMSNSGGEDANSGLRTMCPAVNDEQIVEHLDFLTTHLEAGDSLADARLGVGGSCLANLENEDAAVACALCDAAAVARIWSVNESLLSVMCPDLNDEQIAELLGFLTTRREAGDSLAEARSGVGGSCLARTETNEGAVNCVLCEGTAAWLVWDE